MHDGLKMARFALLGMLALAAMAAVPRAWADTWDDTVKAAIAEGEVDVHGGPGEVFHHILTDGFRQAFPKIKVNFSGLSGRDAIPKIVRERAAGIYSTDVYIGGSSSLLQSLKPINAFAPVRPAFILPEVLDDKAWYGGLDGGWVDRDKKFIFGFEATVTETTAVNRDFIARDLLSSYDDLLSPKVAGKIVFDDPRLPGPGLGAAQRYLLNFGEDWLKRLYSQQKIVYITNPHQEVEWLVSGKYPIGIGASSDEIARFQQLGLGKNVVSFEAPMPHPTLDFAYGSVALMANAPHPNAAKVYINWLLSKAGQTDWGKIGGNSRRIDIPYAVPRLAPSPASPTLPNRPRKTLRIVRRRGTSPSSLFRLGPDPLHQPDPLYQVVSAGPAFYHIGAQ
jgi:ABC-type Fe3+ transport system substrate-binding protein